MTHERGPITDSSAQSASVFVEDVERYRFASQFVAGKRVLDIACGTGYGAELLVRVGHALLVHAIDGSDEAIVQAAGTFRLPQLRFQRGKAEQIPVADGSVDVAVSMETFEHLQAPQLFLHELRRVLVPDGFLIISTPRNDSDTRYHPANPYHVREYSATEFRNALEAVFKSVTMWSQLTDYEDDTPAVFVSKQSPLGKFARTIVPLPARRWLRESMGFRGLQPKYSRIVEGEDPRAAYQIAVCQ